MKCIEFQIQTKEPLTSLIKLLHSIDASAPIPVALEGGDGNGPLYLCILDAKKKEEIEIVLYETPNITLYTGFYTFELEDSMYRPDWYAQWRFGGVPITSPKKF